MAGTTSIATVDVRDCVMIPVVADPRPMGIILAVEKESNWTQVLSVEETSQLKDKVRVGDYVERINYTDVKGWTPKAIHDLVVELKKKNLPISIFFLRKQEGAVGTANSSTSTARTRAADPELITPPAKRLKETLMSNQNGSLQAAAKVSSHITATELRQRGKDWRMMDQAEAVAVAFMSRRLWYELMNYTLLLSRYKTSWKRMKMSRRTHVWCSTLQIPSNN